MVLFTLSGGKLQRKRADVRSQKCRYVWYSHIASHFVVVKQIVQILHQDFHSSQSMNGPLPQVVRLRVKFKLMSIDVNFRLRYLQTHIQSINLFGLYSR